MPGPTNNQIRPGTLPKDGRLTTPVGTYLSNPSTAADGALGANTPQLQIGPPSTLSAAPGFIGGPSATGQGWFADFLKQVFDKPQQPLQLYNELKQPIQGYEQHNVFNGKEETSYNPIAYDFQGNRYTYDPTTRQYSRDETGVFQEQKAPTVYNGTHVGVDFSVAPQNLTLETLRGIFPGRSFDEIKQLMEVKGYTWGANPKGRRESAGMFTLTNPSGSSEQQRTASGALLGPTADNGRPEWVDPTSLERGERVQVASGTTYVGGAKTTEDQGSTPAGTSQYALTVSQNINKKLEAKGAYKWVSRTVKDRDGNWVRIYSKVLRAPYTARGRKKSMQEKRERGSMANKQAPQHEEERTFNQLVSLRVSYG